MLNPITKQDIASTIRVFFILGIPLLLPVFTAAQSPASNFTHDDTLRGSITPERAWWDLRVLQPERVKVDPDNKSISGQQRNTLYAY
jgi:hypothetical protein